jgi:NUMOD3 motif
MTKTIDKSETQNELIMTFLQDTRNRIRSRSRSRKLSEETKLKISRANKGKRLGHAPWNKGKKLHYITGKREHSEQTIQRMSIAAKRRWSV